MDDDFESVLFVCREVMVYAVPARTSLAGYKAQEWGDLNNYIWKGRMRIIETSKDCSIKLEDSTSGEAFAKAPYDHTGTSVEAVLDSSRYFVLRVEDAGKKAYIGVGFLERSESFDFNVALQDYTKRQKALLNPVTEDETESPHVPAGPKIDYSLKEGQTFSISIPGGNKQSKTGLSLGGNGSSNLLGGSGGSGAGAVPLLPPPPSSKRK